jgi:Raf kinase inhibitor-like YbhB/YbcL family protein
MSSSNGAFHLESAAFADGALIPPIHSADGLDLSPPLRWRGGPPQTRSFSLILEDPDAQAGTWVHWVLFNIPGEVHGLSAGLDRSPQLPNGARHGACWGVVDFPRTGYQGPAPPPGQTHRYVFTLFALDRSLALEPGATAAQLRAAMADHQLATAQLTGLYARSG